MSEYSIHLPAITNMTVNLLNGAQTIEVGIRDGRLAAIVPGFADFIYFHKDQRLRVEISSVAAGNVLARIASYRITETGETP